MKTKTSLRFKGLLSLIILFIFTISSHGQVGIGTMTPTENLDVVGNIKLSGALMPNDLPGTANELLLSGGANAPAVWGPEMLNVSQTTSIGKYFINGLTMAMNTNVILTVADANVVASSTAMVTWHQLARNGGGPPITNFTGLHIIAKAEPGQWVFHIENHVGAPLITGFSFVAFY